MKWSKSQKKELLIYVIVAYGITYLMGILMGFAYKNGADVSAFPNAQMMYPAAGVMLAYLIVRKGDERLPKKFFYAYLGATAVMIASTVLSVVGAGTAGLAGVQITIMAGSILCLIMLFTENEESKKAYGLNVKNKKASVFCVVLFIALYLLRSVIMYGLSGQLGMVGIIFADYRTWVTVCMLVINFFFVFIAFFGEEYGWRYYLQPLLQSRYGKRGGVILLGVVWGIWHLPVNFFYYSSPADGIISAAGQQITCITLGIFFAYAYMKTENVWVPVILHFVNNNLVPVISGSYSADVIQNQSINWTDLISALIINGLVFGGFLFAKEFRKKK